MTYQQQSEPTTKPVADDADTFAVVGYNRNKKKVGLLLPDVLDDDGNPVNFEMEPDAARNLAMNLLSMADKAGGKG